MTFRLTSLLLLFTVFTNLKLVMSSPSQDDICRVAFCGEGTCEGFDKLPGFQCKCNPGWTKFNISTVQFPPCILPNCTIDFQCGNGSPPPPPPPLVNFSDPCIINFCGDGSCDKNGADFKCQCFDGSANLFNNPKFPCFKKCQLGADCNGIEVGLPSTPPPANSGRATGDILNRSWKLHMLITMIVLATVFLNFF